MIALHPLQYYINLIDVLDLVHVSKKMIVRLSKYVNDISVMSLNKIFI